MLSREVPEKCEKGNPGEAVQGKPGSFQPIEINSDKFRTDVITQRIHSANERMQRRPAWMELHHLPLGIMGASLYW